MTTDIDNKSASKIEVLMSNTLLIVHLTVMIEIDMTY